MDGRAHFHIRVNILRMHHSLRMIFVSYVGSVLFYRGDTWDAIFLVVFAVSQIVENIHSRLYFRLFLPSLALGKLLLESWTLTPESSRNRGSSTTVSSSSRIRQASGGRTSVGGAAFDDKVDKEKEESKDHVNNEKKKQHRERLPSDVSERSNISSSSQRGQKKERNLTSSISSRNAATTTTTTTRISGKNLSRRLLTLTAHMLVIRWTVNDPATGAYMNEITELVVYAVLLLYAVSLPLFPGLGSILLIVAHDTVVYVVSNFEKIEPHFTLPFEISAVLRKQCTDMWTSTCGSDYITIEQFQEYLGKMWESGKYAFTVSRIADLVETVTGSEACCYALIFIVEKSIMRYVTSLFRRQRSEENKRQKEGECENKSCISGSVLPESRQLFRR